MTELPPFGKGMLTLLTVCVFLLSGCKCLSFPSDCIGSCSPIYFVFITKTHLYNFDPLKPHFYIVKLGFTGVYIIFLILLKNIDCGYSLEPPHRGGSNEYLQSML